MIIKSLELVGAKGIKYGMGLDEINIDFTRFQPGLIAIIGRNGSGKTTLLENLTPYRAFFSRKGKLQNHFEGSDARRILKFQIADDFYGAEIYIDAIRDKTGAVLKKNGIEIATKPTDYSVEIDKLFMSKALFEQSLFFGQDTDRISDLRAGEAKDFMIQLLRLNMLQTLHKRASVYTTQSLKEYELVESRQREITEKLSRRDELEQGVQDTTLSLQALEKALDVEVTELNNMAEVEARISQIKDYQEQKKQLEADQAILRKQAMERKYSNDKILKDNDVTLLTTKLDTARITLQDTHVTPELIAAYNKLKTEHANIVLNMSSLSEKKNNLTAERSQIEAKRITLLHSTKQGLEKERTKLEELKKAAGLIETVPCDDDLGGQCPLLTNAYLYRDSVAECEQRIIDLEAKIIKITNWRKEESETLMNQIDIVAERLKPLQERKTSLDTKLEEMGNVERRKEEYEETADAIIKLEHNIELKSSTIGVENSNYTVYKETFRKSTLRINDDIIKVDTTLKKLTAGLNIAEINIKRTELTTSINTLKTKIHSVTVELGKLQQQLSELGALSRQLKSAKLATRNALCTLGDWQTIEKAFGKNGMQTFEIKAALPSIVRMMNELLIGELGQKFALNFRMKKEGSKGQMLDTFDPLITRYADDGDVMEDDVPLTNLSRGERILIFVAMSEAVGVFLRNSIGLDLKTSFVDEADGPLDPTNRIDYLRTRTHVHDLCGLHHTFIISQSPDIYDRIPQKLSLSKEGVAIII